jgi:ABC-type branched-subunit amino acid transport system substrate-binding protein
MHKPLKVPAALLIGALAITGLAACGSDKKDSASSSSDSGSGKTGADGVKTGPGVTADTITLGVMTDLTGPFKDFSTNLQAGHKMWVDEVNQKGGVCGRKIALETQDHGYKADTATVQFPDVEPKVAGFMELLGSPVIAALESDITDKKVTTLAVSWSSELLDQPYVMIVGSTYDLEVINGLSYMMEKGEIKKGDKIGHIYVDGEYGGDGLLGSQYFAKQNGMTVDDQKVTATDTDMKAVVTKLKSDKVKAIVLTTTPAQTASAAVNNDALGLKVPMLGNNPTFAPALLDTPAAVAPLQRLIISQSAVPFSSTVPKAKELATQYTKDYPQGKPSSTVQYGYAQGLIWGQILQKACDAKDLTRDGIHAAEQASTNITTDKLVSDLDFSKPGSPTARDTYILQVDKASPGGLKQLQALKEYPDAKSYKAPKETS